MIGETAVEKKGPYRDESVIPSGAEGGVEESVEGSRIRFPRGASLSAFICVICGCSFGWAGGRNVLTFERSPL